MVVGWSRQASVFCGDGNWSGNLHRLRVSKDFYSCVLRRLHSRMPHPVWGLAGGGINAVMPLAEVAKVYWFEGRARS